MKIGDFVTGTSCTDTLADHELTNNVRLHPPVIASLINELIVLLIYDFFLFPFDRFFVVIMKRKQTFAQHSTENHQTSPH